MTLAPLPLFSNRKEAVIALCLFIVIFCVHIGYRHAQYLDFIEDPTPYVKGRILHYYEKKSKHGKVYHVLKIQTSIYTLYTTSWKKSLHVKRDDLIGFRMVTKNISFLDYLSRSFFAPTFGIHINDISPPFSRVWQDKVRNQHESNAMQELYGALFFASSIGKELRNDIQQWGVSHLVAISGFHLGVISTVGYFLLMPLYRFFQSRYFPYRNGKIEVGIFIFTILSAYLWLIGFVPSFLRALVMSLIGFFFLIRHIRVLSFTMLSLCVMLILAFFPHLLFSIGFWFSVMGVFYIFLYLHHFKEKFSPWQHTLFINLWVFLAMVIPVHYWFALTSWQQFGAVLLSLLFILFYPLVALLHLFGLGNLLDSPLETLLHVRFIGANVQTPLWGIIGYLGASILSIYNRHLAVCVIALGIFPFFFI